MRRIVASSVDRKIKVSSSQYSYFFGNNQIHFPYSIATLISYAIKDPIIEQRFSFEKVFLMRDRLEEDIRSCIDSDILLCSCYSWNWQITNVLAQEVRRCNPSCLIIFGGPEVPFSHEGFFDSHDYVDILVHQEGEIVLYGILKEYLSEGHYDSILGLETKEFRTEPQPRITDLDVIPSVYSTNLIWKLVDRTLDIKYTVTWETNRGCPYSCTFCDWGSAVKTKVRNFSQKKLFDEIEWFGENEIIYIDCADGNFGIFADRDYELANKLAEVREKTGFPTHINLTWVKASSERIIPIAKRLNDANLLRAVSLSVQSFDETTLKIIKRKNIKFDRFENLVQRFDQEGIQSYTELIMGLPGETHESYKNNWEILASIYPIPAIMVWNCSIFVNAPINDPRYRKAYGIDMIDSPIFIQHSSVDKRGIQEYEKMISATATQPQSVLNKTYLYNWMMLVFHAFGILEFIARFFYELGISYTSFYSILEDWCKQDVGLFGWEYGKAEEHARRGYSGGGWDHIDLNLGGVCWPMEEASWLRLVRVGPDILYAEIIRFLNFFVEKEELSVSENILKDLCEYQLYLINFPTNSPIVERTFKYNWLSHFLRGENLVMEYVCYTRPSTINEEDIIQWGYKTIWYGRREQRYKAKLRSITCTKK